MREPLQEFQSDTYERPNQNWLCGLTETGGPCPMGPGKRGRCPVAAACHPIREGDRWRCNRSPARGGPCEPGPSPEGVCCHVYECRPVRSLRARRGRFVVGCLLATLGGLCLMFSSPWRNAAMAPGELSVHHAPLLERADATQGCATCHAAGTHAFVDLLAQSVDPQSVQPTQTSLCLDCHEKRLSREWATAAHNVDPHSWIAGDSPGGRRRDPHAPLACAVCHQEHHGANHDIAWMSDSACQACHQRRYDSFATDHPEFDQWPASRRTRIAFDHAAHEFKHFPQEKQAYACTGCHQQDASGHFQETLSYEAACATCHDRKIETSWEVGIALFALPTLEVAALRAAGHDIGQWPEQATGEFDGSLPPVVKLLLAGEEPASAALELLGSDFDFFDLDPDDPAQLEAAAKLVWAAKRLMYEVMADGHVALRRRVEAVLGQEVGMAKLAALTSRLSPENLSAIGQWLPNLPAELGAADALPAAPPPALSEQDLQGARSRIACGGWLRDDRTLSIRYLPCGHADPWLTAWIDLLAEATGGQHAGLAESLLEIVMAPTAAGQCGSCHSIDRTEDNRLAVRWLARRPPTSGRQPESAGESPSRFTKFSHGPHLLQSQLADCQACHRTDPSARVMETYAGHAPREFEPGFELLSKASCAECHVSGAAGQSCLQCHQYHAGGLASPASKPVPRVQVHASTDFSE